MDILEKEGYDAYNSASGLPTGPCFYAKNLSVLLYQNIYIYNCKLHF